MKLDVPFIFQIAFIPKGKRNVETVPGRSSTPVEISEAPGVLAFEIGCPHIEQVNYKSHGNVSPFYAPPGETVRVYRAEDAYWVEICQAEDAQQQISSRHEMIRDPFNVMLRLSERNYANSGSDVPKDEEFKTRAELEKKHTALRSWDESGRDRIAAVLQRRAVEDIRVIDGRLCMRVTEPVLDLVFHSTPKEVSAPKPKSHRRFGRVVRRSYDVDPEPVSASPPSGPADGYHLVIAEVSRETPSGFHATWAIAPLGERRWRIDQVEAAVSFIRAEEARQSAADNDARAIESGTQISPDPDKLLRDPELTIAFTDTSACKHEGLSAILRREIDQLRTWLIQSIGGLDKEMVGVALDLQHAFERDGGRLTPDLIAKARAAADLHDAGHGTVKLPYDIAHTVQLRTVSEYGERIEGALPGRIDSLRFALSFWDRRNQADCEWTDRLLPVPVVAGTDFDVVELSTLQRGQDLVDLGCDAAILEALSRIPKEDGLHVVAAETLEGKLLGFAAAIRLTGSELSIERIFAPTAPNPRTLEQMRARFESFAAANLEAAAENDALMGMTF